MQTHNVNPEMNMTTLGHLRANETSSRIVTHHVRHIFMPIDETNNKIFSSHNNLLNATIQSHPIKMGCFNTNKKCLIVTTIIPIWRSYPVHHGTKIYVLISLKSKEIIIFAHNFLKQNTNQATCGLDLQSSIFFSWLRLDTLFVLQSILMSIVQTIVCAVLGAFSKQKQGDLKVSL